MYWRLTFSPFCSANIPATFVTFLCALQLWMCFVLYFHHQFIYFSSFFFIINHQSSSILPLSSSADMTSIDKCEVCEIIMGFLEGLLEKNSTVEQIEKAVHKVCHFLPCQYRDFVRSSFVSYRIILMWFITLFWRFMTFTLSYIKSFKQMLDLFTASVSSLWQL